MKEIAAVRYFFAGMVSLLIGYAALGNAASLENISYNGRVAGEIEPGFIVSSNARVVITAESFTNDPQVSPPLLDPVLSLRTLTGNVFAENDNCTQANIATLIGRPLTTNLDACLVVDLTPELYVVSVSDRGGGSGNTLFSVTEITASSNKAMTDRLIGTWNFMYTIISIWDDTYRLPGPSVESTIEPGEWILIGFDQYGNMDVGAGYAPSLGQYALLDIGIIFDQFYVFGLTNATTASGCYYQVDRDTEDISRCYAMNGNRIATTTYRQRSNPLAVKPIPVTVQTPEEKELLQLNEVSISEKYMLHMQQSNIRNSATDSAVENIYRGLTEFLDGRPPK